MSIVFQTLHGGVLGIHHNSYEIGESSSSRNVRVRYITYTLTHKECNVLLF